MDVVDCHAFLCAVPYDGLIRFIHECLTVQAEEWILSIYWTSESSNDIEYCDTTIRSCFIMGTSHPRNPVDGVAKFIVCQQLFHTINTHICQPKHIKQRLQVVFSFPVEVPPTASSYTRSLLITQQDKWHLSGRYRSLTCVCLCCWFSWSCLTITSFPRLEIRVSPQFSANLMPWPSSYTVMCPCTAVERM